MEKQKTPTALLKDLLFSQPEMKKHIDSETAQTAQNTYVLVNGAGSDKVLLNLMAYEPEYRNLYHDDEAEELEEAAPWLVKLEQDEPFTNWLLTECYNKRLLLFIQSAEEIDTLAEHFRHYTKAEIPNGEETWDIAYFSFYDPSSFSAWAKSLTKEEAIQFFQPITNTWYEDSNQLTLFYMVVNGWEHKKHPLIEAKLIEAKVEKADNEIRANN